MGPVDRVIEAAFTTRGLVWVIASLVVGIGCYRSTTAPDLAIDPPDGGSGDPLDVDEPLDEPPQVPADPAECLP